MAVKVLIIGVDDDIPLPPYLVSNTTKRKKQFISPNDFDFSQLVLVKPNGTKKANIFSILKIDKSKNK